jgi:hypothetical protein
MQKELIQAVQDFTLGYSKMYTHRMLVGRGRIMILLLTPIGEVVGIFRNVVEELLF